MRSLVTPTIEALAPYEAGKPVAELARELGVRDAVKLASNENPLGPGARALEAVRRALADSHRYPDAAAFALREKLAAHHRVAMSELLMGNGSNELLELVVRTFTTPEHHVVLAEPTFVVYKLACLAHGTPFSAVPLTRETYDVDRMLDAVRPNTRLFFVANPNNPTGTHLGRAAVERLFRELPPEVIVVMDEAYFEYAEDASYPDSLALRGLRERLIVTRTFSKIHGLAALRVGYAIGPEKLIDYMNRVRAPFNVNSLGQVAAMAALDDREHVAMSVAMNRAERARLVPALTALGIGVTPSQANFLWVDVRRPGRDVYGELLKKGVIVRPIGAGSCLRITVGTPQENTRMLAALGEVLG